MANRAYLQCIIGSVRRGRELTCSYSLPEVWVDLFDGADLHVGSDCPIPGLTKEHTLSYFLADAAAAIARFAERKRARGLSLEGDGPTARLFALLREEFGEGHLFVDLTELQWMDESGFVASTRRALTRANANRGARGQARREKEPRPEQILSWYGWGTGLSPEERAQAAATKLRNELTARGRPYSPRERYVKGDAILHSLFGPGLVESAAPTMILVSFIGQVKRLVHGRT